MTKIFISGSRMISRLNVDVTRRLNNIIERGHEVLTGDANGVDKAVQRFFAERSYADVTIYHVGEQPRNNVGGWRSVSVDVLGKHRGRELYTQKDKRMAEVSDSGMIVWDGKSSGSVQNMIWMLENYKTSLVYHAPIKKFIKVKDKEDLRSILSTIDMEDFDGIDRKIAVAKYMLSSYSQHSQGSLGF